MNRESYEYYLQLLKIPRNASADFIRAAIAKELRLWVHRANSHKLDVRQQAERMIAALEGANATLLDPQSRIWNKPHTGPDAAARDIQASSPVDVELIAAVIAQVASVRGRRFQERKGATVYRRAVFFYKGVDYVLEESIHKKYEAELDLKRCTALQNALLLFDWHCRPWENVGAGTIKTYVPGSWTADVIAFGREINQG